MAEGATGTAETTKDFGDGKNATVGRWLAEIRAYEKTFKNWSDQSKTIISRYRAEEAGKNLENNKGLAQFNILWSNVQTLQPALYSRIPKADISRKHRDRNAAARAATIILERVTQGELAEGGFDAAMRAARDDHLLTGRGQTWVRYVPTYGDETKDRIFLQGDATQGYTKDDGSPIEGEPLIDDQGLPYIEDGEPYRPVVNECVKIDHVLWSDFGHTPAPNWSRVRAVWKREMMTREQLKERFGEKGEEMSLTKGVANVSDDDKNNYGDAFKRGEVYEIWDKTSRKVIWLSPGYSEGTLDEKDDPLGLENFFPCPEPWYATLTTDSLVPVPDYVQYVSQAREIDRLSQRISLLIKALRVAGAYDGSFADLGKLLDGGDNTMIAVDNWAMFAEKGGLAGAMSFLPIKEIAEVLTLLTGAREQMKRDLQEVTGLSDIVRGQSDPRETYGAQRIKSQFAGARIQDRQAAGARFARDVVKIVAEIVAEHFAPETLLEASGWEFTSEARAIDRAAEEQMKQQQQQQMQAQAGPAMSGAAPGAAPGAPPGGPMGMPAGMGSPVPPMPAGLNGAGMMQ